MPYLNHNIPTITCFIRNEYLFDHEKGHGEFSLCDVHSVASLEKRVPLFEAFLENGVNWTRRPISAFCWKQCNPEPLYNHMYWDCFSSYIDVQIRSRLAGLRAQLVRWDGIKVEGKYLFTLDWHNPESNRLDINVPMFLKWIMVIIMLIPTIELFGMIVHGLKIESKEILDTRLISTHIQ